MKNHGINQSIYSGNLAILEQSVYISKVIKICLDPETQ